MNDQRSLHENTPQSHPRLVASSSRRGVTHARRWGYSGVLVFALVACSSSSAGPSTCTSAMQAACSAAVACPGGSNGASIFFDGNNSGTSFATLAQCNANYTGTDGNLCSSLPTPAVGWAACQAAISSGTCGHLVGTTDFTLPQTCGNGGFVPFVQPDASTGAPDVSTTADSGCGPFACTPLASGLNLPGDIAVDATSVYWVDTGTNANAFKDGAILKVAITGGTTTTLASAQDNAQDLAADTTNVYWTTIGSVIQAPKAGGTATTLISTTNVPEFIAVGGTNVVFVETVSPAIVSVPIGGGSPATLVSGTNLTVLGIAADADSVYWTNDTPVGGCVMKVPLAGGTPTTLVSGCAAAPGRLTVDSANVYWASAGATNGSIQKVSLAGGAVTTLASGLSSPTGVTVDATNVYWTSHESHAVMSVPIAGGVPTTIATTSFPEGIAVDNTSVYWSDSGGSVWRAPKTQ